MRKIIVTTAGRPDEQSVALAVYAAEKLQAQVVERKKRSVSKLQETYNADVIVAGKTRFEYFTYGSKEPFFYHPNAAAFRLKRLAKGEIDPMVDICGLRQGDSFLDCTLGLGADSLVAQYVVGEGRVVGVEADPVVAFIVREGMQHYDLHELPIASPMRNIEVVQAEAVDYLKTLPDNAFDIVFMDPMFDEVIEESSNFTALRDVGAHIALNAVWVQEAYRVAKRGVVLKAHFRSPWFEQFGFTQDKRQTSKFHYGFLKKNYINKRI